LHGTLLVGEPQPIARLGPNLIASLERFTLNLSCDGVLREVGTGANVLGSPLLAIAHLISVLAKQPQYMPLQTDELVTTGTITTAKPAHAGQTWRTEVNGIALPGTATGFTQ
jgi:2-keto-4-pentenoate hydratase